MSDYVDIISEGRPLQQRTRTILQQSKDAQKYTPQKTFERQERTVLTLKDSITPPRFWKNKNGVLTITIENNTDFSWPKGVVMQTVNAPEGVLLSSFRSQEVIAPGRQGEFKAKIRPTTISNGLYALTLEPVFLKSKINAVTYEKLNVAQNIQITGDRNLLTRVFNKDTTVKTNGFTLSQLQANSFKAKQEEAEERKQQEDKNRVKIKLSYLDLNYLLVSSTESLRVVEDGKEIFRLKPGEQVRVVNQSHDNRSWLDVYDAQKRLHQVDNVRLISDGILKIHNYDRGINSKVPFNSFRSDLQVYPQKNEGVLVVNDLPLEEYLYGIAEETSAEPNEKRKAILVLARSYALVYSGDRRKFKTHLYDLEDSAASSQLYLGHDWERYHSSQKALVDETQGLVLYYQGRPVIGPYFTQSGGASSSKWLRQYPWTRGRELPYDRGLEPKGHGVGLSGNSARKLAEKGMNFREIIDYFYDETSVGKEY